MKNLKRSLLSLLLVLVLFISSFVPSVAAETQPSKYSKEYNSGQRDVVCTTLNGTSAGAYYTGSYTYDRLSALSAESLKSSLSTLMKTTHSYTSSYNDCHYEAHRTDCENENGSSNKLLLIYTSYTATQSQWNGWNREHVWPQSLGGNNTSGGGADLHHIRPSDATVNSTRGNKKYGYADGGKAVNGTNPASGYLGGHYSTYFEPLDNVKGDVARICLYVLVRWGTAWGAESITEVFQSVDVLLEWCEMDPVDTWEMGRNEVVEDIQGNRNVFIDYPEYAWLIFGREVPDDMQTPSGEAMNGGSSCAHTNTEVRNKSAATCTTAGNSGDTYCKDCGRLVKAGTVIAAKGHVIEIRNQISATCTENGYSGDKYCTVCNTKVSSGTAIPASHTWSAWQEFPDEGVRRRSCTVCSTTQSQALTVPVCTHTSTETRDALSATCGTSGYTGDTYCKDCGEKVKGGTVIAATGKHTWSEPVVTVQPTPDKAGEAVSTCKGCGATNTTAVQYVPTPTPPTPPTPSIPEKPTWGSGYSTEAEQIVAIISKNALYSYVVSLLTRA